MIMSNSYIYACDICLTSAHTPEDNIKHKFLKSSYLFQISNDLEIIYSGI